MRPEQQLFRYRGNDRVSKRFLLSLPEPVEPERYDASFSHGMGCGQYYVQQREQDAGVGLQQCASGKAVPQRYFDWDGYPDGNTDGGGV